MGSGRSAVQNHCSTRGLRFQAAILHASGVVHPSAFARLHKRTCGKCSPCQHVLLAHSFPFPIFGGRVGLSLRSFRREGGGGGSLPCDLMARCIPLLVRVSGKGTCSRCSPCQHVLLAHSFPFPDFGGRVGLSLRSFRREGGGGGSLPCDLMARCMPLLPPAYGKGTCSRCSPCQHVPFPNCSPSLQGRGVGGIGALYLATWSPFAPHAAKMYAVLPVDDLGMIQMPVLARQMPASAFPSPS
jgi:hypothetical protein